jgi:hypothetical protein
MIGSAVAITGVLLYSLAESSGGKGHGHGTAPAAPAKPEAKKQ